MKIKEVLDRTTLFFKEKKIDTARLDAEILLSSSLGIRRIDLYLKFDQPLAETELERCRALVRRRSTGEPVAYIVGSKGFMGFDFEVNSAVLIPRPETELLVEQALAWVHESSKENEPLEILDLGSGSGCIGVSLLKNLPNAKCVFVDLSSEALVVAKKNAESLGVLDRAEFVNIDAAKFTADKQFDLVLANPPYIAQDDINVQESVRKFEPHMALFSDENGLYALKAWSKNLVGMLKSNSFVGFEYGMGQSAEAKLHFQALGCFNEIEIIQDYSKIDRHIFGVRRDA